MHALQSLYNDLARERGVEKRSVFRLDLELYKVLDEVTSNDKLFGYRESSLAVADNEEE